MNVGAEKMDWNRYANPSNYTEKSRYSRNAIEPGERGKEEGQYKEYKLLAHAIPGQNDWTVEAYAGDWVKVAEASFVGVYEFGEEGARELVALKGWDVSVHAEHRRRGLARAMYVFAERAFGLPLLPGDFQTPEGAAFLGGASSANPKGTNWLSSNFFGSTG